MRYVIFALMLFCANLHAKNGADCQNKYLAVEGDINDKLVQIVFDNAAACFQSLNDIYFQLEEGKPLKIYACQTAADAKKLIEDHGHSTEAANGFYVHSAPAIYAYTTNDDMNITLEPLFAGIAEYLVDQSFSNPPEWFRSGLIIFLSKHAQIIGGKLTPAGPCPSAGFALRAEVEADTRLNIKRLYGYGSSDEGYRKWSTGPHLAAALLCWLHQNGHLANYIHAVRQKGYELDILEEAVGASAGKINVDLKKFIEGDWCTAAHLADAENTRDPNQKEKAILAALKEKPDYPEAQLALARLYYNRGNLQSCHRTLVPLLAKPDGVQFLPAAILAARTFYDQTSYAQARDHYQMAWAKAENYVYKYQIAYKIANCSHQLNEPETAAQRYKEFLELNFQPEQDPASIEYAEKYVEAFGK